MKWYDKWKWKIAMAVATAALVGGAAIPPVAAQAFVIAIGCKYVEDICKLKKP